MTPETTGLSPETLTECASALEHRINKLKDDVQQFSGKDYPTMLSLLTHELRRAEVALAEVRKEQARE